MNKWKPIANRIVDCVAPSAGELIRVCDCAGQTEVLYQVLAEIQVRGATPQIDFEPPAFIEEWLSATTPTAIAEYGRHRLRWMHEIDKTIVLGGDPPDFSRVNPAVLAQWQAIHDQRSEIEDQRHLPMVV
jgi:hypothetical protein